MDEKTAAQPVIRRAAKKKAVKRPKALWMKHPRAAGALARGKKHR